MFYTISSIVYIPCLLFCYTLGFTCGLLTKPFVAGFTDGYYYFIKQEYVRLVAKNTSNS